MSIHFSPLIKKFYTIYVDDASIFLNMLKNALNMPFYKNAVVYFPFFFDSLYQRYASYKNVRQIFSSTILYVSSINLYSFVRQIYSACRFFTDEATILYVSSRQCLLFCPFLLIVCNISTTKLYVKSISPHLSWLSFSASCFPTDNAEHHFFYFIVR